MLAVNSVVGDVLNCTAANQICGKEVEICGVAILTQPDNRPLAATMSLRGALQQKRLTDSENESEMFTRPPAPSFTLSPSLLPHSQGLIQSSQLANSNAMLRTHSIWQPRQSQLSHSATGRAKTCTIWCYHREKRRRK